MLQQQDTSVELFAGRYQLVECIGEGGMARVYRALDTQLGRVVAVKIMQPNPEMATSTTRARTEMRALASLNHPALVKLFDASVEDEEHPYLVMEFVDGTTLSRRLHGGALPVPEVAHLGRELASGLHAVHTAGIVHRDVKPSNVLLAANPIPGRPARVKLADFGVAFLVDTTRVTSPGLVVGTAAYLSPEQVRGEAVTSAADIYALGLVLLEALTGSRAYPDASGVGAVMARLIDPPSIPEWVGPGWAQLLSRMTAIDPTRRPTALEVARAVHGLPTDIGPASSPAEPPVTQQSPAVPATPLPRTREMSPVPEPQTRAALRLARPPARKKRRPVVLMAAAAAAATCIAATAVAVAVQPQPSRSDDLVAVVDEPIAPTPEPTTPNTGLGEIETVSEQSTIDQQTNDSPLNREPGSTGPAVRDGAQTQQDAKAAQREADKAERAAEREQRASDREAAKRAKSD